jgi:kynurenine formamidase
VPKLIDCSISIENDLPSDPPEMAPRVKYLGHDSGADQMKLVYPGLDPECDLPDGKGWAIEFVTLCTHSGTHLDAPWHYHPTTDGGRRAPSLDELPLTWCLGRGVKLDFSHCADGYLVTAKDLDQAFTRIGHKLSAGEIVLVYTGAGAFWGRPDYMQKGCGMGREATLWLCERGVRVMGTDAWSWDRPLAFSAREFKESNDPSVIWEGHFAGIEKSYCHLEKLANLDQLPATGFTFFCFPIKIKGASAGWVRAVALVDD